MIAPTLHRDITTYGDVRYKILTKFENSMHHWGHDSDMYDSLKSATEWVKSTENFNDLRDYFRRTEESANTNFIKWLKDFGIISYSDEWYEEFKKTLTGERVRLHRLFAKEWEKEMAKRFHGFDDDDMNILEI